VARNRIRRGEYIKNLTLEEVERRIQDVHGTTLRLIGSYVNAKTKCLFCDILYGEWLAQPREVMRGTKHPKRARVQARTSLSELCSRLQNAHDGRVTFVGPYVDQVTPTWFHDVEYGDWKAQPSHVLRGHGHPERGSLLQRVTWKKTLLRKYGVDHPSKLIHVQDKIARSTNKATVERHWKTNDELLCVGSWELAVVRWLNVNQTDYEWQPGPFTMPDGRTYRPDALITTGVFLNTYIEVKGYMRADAKAKWEWFHVEHPNSQLWMKKELQKPRDLA